jgi:putative transposase
MDGSGKGGWMVSSRKNYPHRHSIRLAGYDYAQPSIFFVTICTCERRYLFGDVRDGEMRLNHYGRIAREYWTAIPDHFGNTALDEFVVMPDHIHGIIVISDLGERYAGARRTATDVVGARHAVPLRSAEQFGKPVCGSIPTIVRSYKSVVTNRINQIHGTPGSPAWQRNYWEHIIRNEDELIRIRDYIRSNPRKWDSERMVFKKVDKFLK